MKFDLNKIYKDRLEQITNDLKKEYYKGNGKNKSKIAKLLQEKERIEKCNGGRE